MIFIAKLGAVTVPLNTFLSDAEVAYRFEDAGAKAVICDSEYVERVQNILQQTSVQPIVITVGNEGDHSLKSLVEKASPEPPKIAVGYEDLAAIMYTGGTTGRSKGVMHTHKSTISLMYSEIVEFELERRVVMLHIAPLPHAVGFMILLGLLRGGTHILQQGFDPKKFCETVGKGKSDIYFPRSDHDLCTA